jgi:hypothetical protein
VLEHARPSLRIVPAHDLALGFVVEQHARQRRHATPQFPAIQQNSIARPDAGAERGRDPVHGQPTGANPALHVAPRTKSEPCQNLLQALSGGSVV